MADQQNDVIPTDIVLYSLLFAWRCDRRRLLSARYMICYCNLHDLSVILKNEPPISRSNLYFVCYWIFPP